ncbi:MAG: protein translocase subunit SecF [Ruminococcus sp.]|nr:protein translocase subunit SecF [Ruminococcus sp.]
MVNGKKVLNVVGRKKIFYCISLCLITLFIVLSLTIKPKVAIEFKGGTILTYTYEGDITANQVNDVVKDTLNMDAVVTKGEDSQSNSKTVKISFSSSKGISDEKQTKLKAALEEAFADNNIEVYETNDVEASNGMNFFFKCLVAVVFAMIITIIYIAFRFRNIGGLSAGVFSVVALFHDMCMVYGTFVICRFDISANFMAVMLTILGYSINATIIIYDRIRENERILGKKLDLKQLVNLSVTQTLGRSIHTTVTTVLAMATVCIVCVICGVSSIISFAFPLIIGMIAGVYSSNCIAPTLWVTWKSRSSASNKSKKSSAKKQGSRR